MTFITGGSGGLGKSSTARALAHALGQAGYRTVLVDGNPGQQSQRVFLRLDDAHGLEYATLADLKRTLVMPDRTHAQKLLPSVGSHRLSGFQYAALLSKAMPRIFSMTRTRVYSIMRSRCCGLGNSLPTVWSTSPLASHHAAT